MGTSNLAAKRGAKANRRKQIVAQKRKFEALGESLAGQAARFSALPIRACLLSDTVLECGMGTLVLARGSTVGPVFFSAFLLDTYCRGVKNTMARAMDAPQVEAQIARLNASTPLSPVDPSYARRMLRELVQWSASLGFGPHRDYHALERLFGDVDPELCRCDFEFGMNGKPVFINGPNEPLLTVGRIMQRLRKDLGPDGYDYMIAAE